ncbi:MAG: OmpH family outer membrane protein [Bacteroidales bacterium]
MKNVLKLLFIAALLMAGPVVHSQTVKFGHINSSRLLNLMPEREAAQRELQREAQSLGEELEKLQVEYNNKLQNYMEVQDSLTSVVRQLRERELRELQTRIQEFQAGAEEDLQQREMELIQPIFEKIEKVISEVARERGYIYVFDIDANSILYFSDESEDILPFVRERLEL